MDRKLTDRSSDPFRLLSWNVHMGLHNDGGLNAVADVVADVGPDVVVLQEAWWYGSDSSDLVDQVADAIGGSAHGFTAPVRLEKYDAWWTVAVICRGEVERLDDVVIPSRPGLERRAVAVRHRSGLTIAGMHLDGVHAWNRPRLAVAQRRAFQRHVGQYDVIAGDLNLWATAVNRDAGPMRPAVTGRTWPSSRPHSQIDHVLVGPHVDVVSAQVLPDAGSDHRPIVATLRPTDA